MSINDKLHKIFSEYGIHDFGEKDLDPEYQPLFKILLLTKILVELEKANELKFIELEHLRLADNVEETGLSLKEFQEKHKNS